MSRPRRKKVTAPATCTYAVAYKLHDASCDDTFTQGVCYISEDGTDCEQQDTVVDCNTALPE